LAPSALVEGQKFKPRKDAPALGKKAERLIGVFKPQALLGGGASQRSKARAVGRPRANFPKGWKLGRHGERGWFSWRAHGGRMGVWPRIIRKNKKFVESSVTLLWRIQPAGGSLEGDPKGIMKHTQGGCMARPEEGAKALEDAALPQADREFEAAVLSGDFNGVKAALKAGADPNRVFVDQWREENGSRAIYYLAEWNRKRGDDKRSAQDFASEHAGAMKALVEAGANFSLPCNMWRAGRGASFSKKSDMNFSSRAVKLWEAKELSIDSCVWFAKGGGDLSGVFSSESSNGCPATHSRMMRKGLAQDVLGPLWDLAIKPLMGPGGELELLSETLGSGLLEWSQWLISKGAKPVAGSNALRMMAHETIFYANPARSGHCAWEDDKVFQKKEKARMLHEVLECSRLAVELGEDLNESGPGRFPPLLSLLAQQGKSDVDLSLTLAKKWVELGAAPLGGHQDAAFIAYALADSSNAMKQLDFALSLGADPKDRARASVFVLLKRAVADHDKQAAGAIEKLVGLGADLSQGANEPIETSLVAMAARSGLWESIKALEAAGCSMGWKDPATGGTAMSLAAEWSVACGRSGCAEMIARWMASKGAPLDEPGKDGFTALHRAAKALDFKLCQALLDGGADASRPMADKAALTPAHLACARFEKKKEKAQLKTLEALAKFGANFTKLDGKGRSVMEIASKKSFLSVVMTVANQAEAAALDGESGARAAKTLGSRGEGFLAVKEKSELRAVTAESSEQKPRRARSSL
jgi:hypothetical protein